MKKILLLGILSFGVSYSATIYNAIIEGDSFYVEEPVITPDPISGYIIDLFSINNSSSRNKHDVTKTEEPTWYEYYGQTHDMVINQVSAHNQSIQKTGVIDWFDPDRVLSVKFQEACQSGDNATSDIEYLDENDNILFWTKTRSKGSFGIHFRYGKNPDFSDSHETGTSAPYPYVAGDLIFDKDNGTVSFKNNITNSNYKMNDWTFSGVDVKNIKKIRLSNSYVKTSYSGGTCGADVRMFIEAINEY